MKIISVVGARPNFMKVAPIIAAIKEHNEKLLLGSRNGQSRSAQEMIEHVLVHTGQHYDELMSDVFFSDLGLPKPDIHLGVGSGSHAVQTAEVMKRFEAVLLQERRDVVIVVGDVNSTLACALVAAKISLDCATVRPLIAHIEAGLRSLDRSMPEEHNRVLTDHLSDILFVTEESGLENLRREGIPRDRVHFVGNTMIDSLLAFKEKADASSVLDTLRLRNQARESGRAGPAIPYALLTIHRPSNVDDRDTFLTILKGLQPLGSKFPIIFVAHPRTRERIKEFGFDHFFGANLAKDARNNNSELSNPIQLIPPLGYLDFLCLMKNAKLIVTDSGGIQEETTCLGIPCVTVRENTERPVTMKNGTNVIGGVTKDGIQKAIDRQLRRKTRSSMPAKWDGQAGPRILEVILRYFRKRQKH